MRVGVLVALLLAAGLAGCSDEADTAASETTTGSLDGAEGQSVALAFDATPSVYEESFTDTFQVQQNGDPGWVAGEAGVPPDNRHRYDISAQVPQGVPVRVSAEVNAELNQGDLDLWVEFTGEEWAGDWDTPYGGYSSFVVDLVSDGAGPVEVVVQYDEVDDSDSFDYTLDVSVEVDPGVVHDGVPAMVLLRPGDVLVANLTDSIQEDLIWMFAPDDTFLGRFNPEGNVFRFEVTADHSAGEYVFLIAEDGPSATLMVERSSDDATAPLGVMRYSFVFGDGHGVESQTATEWTEEVPRIPIWAGLFLDGQEASLDAKATMTSPGGLRLQLNAGGACISCGWSAGTGTAASGLDAGEYTFTYEDSAGDGAMVHGMFMFLERP